MARPRGRCSPLGCWHSVRGESQRWRCALPPDTRCRLLYVLALGVLAAGCDRATLEPSVRAAPLARLAVVHAPERSGPTAAAPAFRYGERAQAQTPDAAWLAAAREDPDPNVRMHALEAWAQHPGESLDPATYALVDPDETVRARAQELVEEALARR
jgi:hypothetical protein